jgi:hypothetical protein
MADNSPRFEDGESYPYNIQAGFLVAIFQNNSMIAGFHDSEYFPLISIVILTGDDQLLIHSICQHCHTMSRE